MTEEKISEENQGADPFMRALSSYNTKLLGQKESVLTDMQVLAESSGVVNFTDKVEECLCKLADIDYKLDSLRKAFSKQSNGEEEKHT